MANLNLNDSSPSTNSARKTGYADLDLSLTKHPIRNDIVLLKDDKAIKNAVKNLLRSNFYERPFQPTLGVVRTE